MIRGTRRWISVLFPLLIIAAVAVSIYANSFSAPFVFDDLRNISENDGIRDLPHLLMPKFFFQPRRPVFLTFALTYHFWKLDVFWFHLGNVIIHIFAGWAAYFLALAMLRHLPAGHIGNARTAALFAALVFAAHPVQTQAVTYIVQRLASMSALFYMVSVLFYIMGRSRMLRRGMGQNPSVSDADRRRTTSNRVAVLLLFLLSAACGVMAVLCKESAASLPGVIILAEIVLFDRTWRGWKKKSLWFGVVCAVWLVFLLFLTGVLKTSVNGDFLEDVASVSRMQTKVTRWNYLFTQFSVVSIYIRLLFVPVKQCVDYLYPFKTGFFDGLTPLAFLFLASIAVWGILAVKRYPVVTLGIGWFFITLSVESSFIPITDALFEHRLYPATFGFALLVSWFLFRVFSGRRFITLTVCTALLVAFATGTVLRNRAWRSEEALWADVVAKSPHNYRALNNLGHTLAKQERYEEAVECIKKSLDLKPNYAEAFNNLGHINLAIGDAQTALDFSSKALQLRPSFGKAHQNLGNALVALDRPEEALPHYHTALESSRDSCSIRNNLGLALAKLGRMSEAIQNYREALKLAPDDPEILTNLGLALARQGDYAAANRSYEKALTGDPEYAEAHHAMGMAMGEQGDLDKAARCYAAAVRINPGYAEAFNNLGLLLAGQGRADEAIRQYTRAVAVDPAFAEAHNNLGAVLAQQGRLAEAAGHFSQAVKLKPAFADAHNNLGNAMTMKKRYEEAIHHYHEALRLNPELHAARNNLEIVKKRMAAGQ